MKIYHAPNTRSVRIVWLFEELGLTYDIEALKLGDPRMRDPESGMDVIIVSTVSDHQAAYWQQRLDATRGQVAASDDNQVRLVTPRSRRCPAMTRTSWSRISSVASSTSRRTSGPEGCWSPCTRCSESTASSSPCLRSGAACRPADAGARGCSFASARPTSSSVETSHGRLRSTRRPPPKITSLPLFGSKQ